MVLGSVPISVSQSIIVANWLLEGNFKNKWLQLKSSKIFLVLISVFIMHALGLIYTQNIQDGLLDLRTVIPLFLLPLVFFSTTPPTLRELYFVLYSFILGCTINTAWCFIYSFVLHSNDVARDASRFMSHIRLGLYINMAICCCIYFAIKQKTTIKKILFLFFAVYFVFMLYALGLASGIFNLVLLFIIFGLIVIFKQQLKFKISALIILIIGLFFFINYIKGVYKSQFTLNKTVSANYTDQNSQMENGNIVFDYSNNLQLQQQWIKRMPVDSFNYEPSFYNINKYYVLIRYLTSKGLTKDSTGISKLTTQDLINIKNNVTNYLYPNWGYLHKRIYELVNEYDELKHHRNVNGHSLTMRLYFWKAAFEIIKRNPLIGIGTGDVQDELNTTYVKTNSPLSKEWHKRPHNQFITITVAFGIIGLFIFLISLIYPLVKLRKQLFVLYFPFFILLISSFILEDTLESQAGMSFYVTFNTLFISFSLLNAKSIRKIN
ncbi:MAG: O-antigen ligase family protein [Bacteroidota bacterium]|nr:O-antigen ligase family protein [Bacteroidota bacterium]